MHKGIGRGAGRGATMGVGGVNQRLPGVDDDAIRGTDDDALVSRM